MEERSPRAPGLAAVPHEPDPFRIPAPPPAADAGTTASSSDAPPQAGGPTNA
jgi:hypothetical protein